MRVRPATRIAVGLLVVVELFLLILLFSPVFIDRRGKGLVVVEHIHMVSIRDQSSQTTADTEVEHRLDQRETLTLRAIVLVLFGLNLIAIFVIYKRSPRALT